MSIKQTIADKISLFIDPVMQDIPSDPILLSYQHSENVRILSVETVEQMLNQLEEARQFIIKAEKDGSGIRIALDEALKLSIESPTGYQAILITMISSNLTGQQIAIICELMDGMVLTIRRCANDYEASALLLYFRTQLGDNSKLLEAYITAPKEEKSLYTLFFDLFLQQTAMVRENRGKLYDKKNQELRKGKILCPYTREVIDAEKSLQSKNLTQDFLAIAVFLSHLAEVKDDAIIDFLANQPTNYLDKAEVTLQNYIKKPYSFAFKQSERQFLDEIGVKEICQQTLIYEKIENSYRHLWNGDKSDAANVGAILADYSKSNSFFPAMSLFFTGHWNRHHHQLVKKANAALNSTSSLMDVINQLETEALKTPNFNTSGSLARRIKFIKEHIKVPEKPNDDEFNLKI